MDAALIKFPESKSFVFDKHLLVTSICLPWQIDNIDKSWDGEMFTMTGFGHINSKGDTPKKLQLAQERNKKKFNFKCMLKYLIIFHDFLNNFSGKN